MSARTPSVSVIIPCRNHAPFLAERLASVLGQTMPDFEVIFLDDGSTDGSYETARGLTNDPRVRFLRAEPPTGNPFAAWRLGLSLAQAPLVWIAESDDAGNADFLADLLPLFALDPGLGMAYCQSVEMDADSRVIGSLLAHTNAIDAFRWQTDYVAQGPEECRRALLFRNTIPNASACLFRAVALRPALESTGGFSLCGDWAAYATLLLAGWRIAYRAGLRNRYRRHAGTQRQNLARHGVEIAEGVAVRQRIKAAISPSPEDIALASALILEHLTDLAVACGARAASRWFDDGRLLRALLDFDPSFLTGLAGAAPNRRLWLDIYAEDGGVFHEGRKCTLSYAPNRSQTLTALAPAGRLRIDPSGSPGLLRIQALRVFAGDDDRLLAVFEGTGLAACGLDGSCLALACDAAGLLLYAYGSDPIMLLPSLGTAGETVRLEVVLTGLSLVGRCAPLSWPAQ